MKKILIVTLAVFMVFGFAACTSEVPESTSSASQAAVQETAAADEAPEAETGSDKLVMGFAQIGQESGWRDAETADIKEYAETHADTVELYFSDGQQKQENQIKAIRTFIQQGVDVIGVAPVVSTGWEAVLQECKDAGIPVIFLDRKADVTDDLYATYIGPDVVLEGTNAGIEMKRLLDSKGNVVILEGTVGSSPANDRQQGFMDEIADTDIKVLASQSGDFTRVGGKEVMESFIKSFPDQIDAVYAHNDDMYLGAIEAIKEAGLQPGVDIKSVSCDGVKGIFEAMVAGEANVTVECNPLLAKQLFDAAWRLKNGEEIERWIKSEEGIFCQETAGEDILTRKY